MKHMIETSCRVKVLGGGGVVGVEGKKEVA